MINDAEISVLLSLLLGSCGFVHGQDKSSGQPSGIFDGHFGLVSMLIIVLFCICGTFFCLYFTCCHEYMCEPDKNGGCCYRRLTDEELKPKSTDEACEQ